MNKNTILSFLKNVSCIYKSGKLFKLIPLLSLPFLLISTNVVAQETYWEYAGETYNNGPLASDARAGLFLDWAKKIADFDGPLDVCGVAVPDGEVQFVSRDGSTFSVLNWSRPYYDHMTRTIRMHLYASNLKRNTTIRVGADGSVGGPVEALSWEPRFQCATYAIPTRDIEPFGDSFDITVYAHNGGTVSEKYLAKYFFRRR
jgi:hypothetical protein